MGGKPQGWDELPDSLLLKVGMDFDMRGDKQYMHLQLAGNVPLGPHNCGMVLLSHMQVMA